MSVDVAKTAMRYIGESMWTFVSNYTSPIDAPSSSSAPPATKPIPPSPDRAMALGILLCVLVTLGLVYVVRSTLFALWKTAKATGIFLFWAFVVYVMINVFLIVLPHTIIEHAGLSVWRLLEHYLAFTGVPAQLHLWRESVLAFYGANASAATATLAPRPT